MLTLVRGKELALKHSELVVPPTDAPLLQDWMMHAAEVGGLGN